jgi:hypothetical protein
MAGCDSYITKPVETLTLANELREAAKTPRCPARPFLDKPKHNAE